MNDHKPQWTGIKNRLTGVLLGLAAGVGNGGLFQCALRLGESLLVLENSRFDRADVFRPPGAISRGTGRGRSIPDQWPTMCCRSRTPVSPWILRSSVSIANSRARQSDAIRRTGPH